MKVLLHCLRVWPGSEIYGGLANTWDYGNLGVELKNNVKKAWWQKFIQESPYNVGVDCAILMNPQTWVASGHLGGFSDPLMDCKECHERFRADKIIEDFAEENHIECIEGIMRKIHKHNPDLIFERVTPHCFRHTFATRCLEANIPLKTVSQILGHSQLQLTTDLYMHVTTDMLFDSLEQFERKRHVG